MIEPEAELQEFLNLWADFLLLLLLILALLTWFLMWDVLYAVNMFYDHWL